MPNKHLSSAFDAALIALSTHLLEMGGIVEMQIERCLQLISRYEPTLVSDIRATERHLNALEISIDQEIQHVIARRQPTASDLRLLMAVSKCVTNLERAGDETRKISKSMRRISESGDAATFHAAELKKCGELAYLILHRVLEGLPCR